MMAELTMDETVCSSPESCNDLHAPCEIQSRSTFLEGADD